MRKGRFAALSDNSPEAAAPLSTVDLLLFDFLAAEDERGARVALDRARPLSLVAPFLAGIHGVGAAVLALCGAGWMAVVPALAGVLASDWALWFLARRTRTHSLKPHILIRLTALHIIAAATIWITLMGSAAIGAGGDPAIIEAALLTGAAAGIAAFFAVPGLMLLSCLLTVGAVSMFAPPGPFLGIAAGLCGALALLSIFRAREAILSAYRRLSVEWQAQQARRFVADFEQSKRGWFWETNADGALTYVSDQLAGHLGGSAAELAGRRFGEILILQENASPDAARHGLDFHLSARFPFSDIIVRAQGGDEICWSLAGSPNFDEYGRFTGFRGIGTNLTEQRRSEAEINKLAKYDSLTGLPNRAMMRLTLDEALVNAARRKKGCSLFAIDLDRFKQVNDTLGHPVGDVLLRQVAERLREAIGDEGQIGRLGGDEFEAILPGMDAEGRLGTLAGKLIKAVSKPYTIGGHKIRIGASIGIAVGSPGKCYAEGLIKDADLALYAAKTAGKGTFRHFAPEMHVENAERQILERDLRGALAQGQLRLLYQPIFDAVTEEVVAFEAVLRWAHPTRGVLSPASFAEVAEETGLMPAIGEWALRTACAEAGRWPRHVRVAVNLSPLQLSNPALPAILTNVIAAAQIEADRLELGISEGSLDPENAAAGGTLSRLKAVGVRLALEGFGTGRSSFGHLRAAPFDKIKIDKSCVQDAAEGNRTAAIVRAIVTLAESLAIDVIAEGVETHTQLALVRRLGCSQIQGAAFARPMPAGEALTLAARSKGGRAQSPDYSRPPRHRLIRMGNLQWAGKAVPVRLCNISAGGAMLECDEMLEPGERVVLDLAEAGLVEAEIRWSRDGRHGLRFERAFDMQSLAASKRPGVKMLRPQYLESETSPDSPWAGPKEALTPKAARRL